MTKDSGDTSKKEVGKGTAGIIFYYGESPISWSTQKQATVALSSCESEFIAATAATTQALWLKRLLSKLTNIEEDKVTVKVDNKSAIALMKNPVFHGKSKHIDTKDMKIQDLRTLVSERKGSNNTTNHVFHPSSKNQNMRFFTEDAKHGCQLKKQMSKELPGCYSNKVFLLFFSSVGAFSKGHMLKRCAVGGPGFLKFKLCGKWVATSIHKMLTRGIDKLAPKFPVKKTIIDFLSRNVATEMHMDHIRSAIIGETLACILEYSGVHVQRKFQYGNHLVIKSKMMMTELLIERFPNGEVDDQAIGELEVLYKDSKKRFDEDAEFGKRAQQVQVGL
nr:arginine--tRNA ligase, chloroplastic/mitochondrial-like isoform X2 [Tanacetum cinerariifolium]